MEVAVNLAVHSGCSQFELCAQPSKCLTFRLPCSNSTAVDFLKAENFNVQSALNRFFNADVVAVQQDSKSEVLFNKYKSTLSDESRLAFSWPILRLLALSGGLPEILSPLQYLTPTVHRC